LKILFLVSLVLLFVLSPVYGQPLSDATGLVNRLDIKTDGYSFEIEITSNFNIPDFNFDKDEKKLSLFINSGLENNLGEILLPRTLLGGNFTFYLNDQQYYPKINSNEKISFITLNFTGSGENKLDIFGTTYLDGLSNTDETKKELIPLEKGDILSDSLGWVVMLGILSVAVVITVFQIKKRK